MINWIEKADVLQQAYRVSDAAESSQQFLALLKAMLKIPERSGTFDAITRELGNFFLFFHQLTNLDVQLLEPLPLDDQQDERTIVAEQLVYKIAKSVYEANKMLEVLREVYATKLMFTTLEGVTKNLLDFVDENIRELLPETTQNELDRDMDIAILIKSDPATTSVADFI